MFLFAYFWNHRDHFVIFLLIYTPFEELIIKMLPHSAYAYTRFLWEGMLFLMMALVIIENMVLSKKWKRSPIDTLAIMFLVIWIFSTIDNSRPLISSLSILKNIVRYMPLFYIIYNLKPDRIFLYKIVRIIILMAVFQSIICIGQAIEGDFLVEIFRPKDVVVGGELIRGQDIQLGSYHTRFTGSFSRASDLGHYLTFGICLVLGGYFKTRRKPEYLFALALMLIALFLSSSRISWISTYFAAGVILIYAKHRLRFAYFAAPLIVVLVFIVGIVSLNMNSTDDDFSIVDRFAYMFTSDYIEIIGDTGRLYALQSVVPAVLRAEPILGLGPGSFLKISQQMPDEEVYADAQRLALEPEPLAYVHDVGYATILVQVGILGSMALIMMFFRIYRAAALALKNIQDSKNAAIFLGAIGFFVAVAIQNFASFNITYRNQSILLWTICGLIALNPTVKRPTLTENGSDKGVLAIPNSNHITEIKHENSHRQ